MKPRPIPSRPPMLASVSGDGPSPAVRLRWLGYWVCSVSSTGPNPPAAARPTSGRLTNPSTISRPWNTSDQTTATKPPPVR